MRMFLNCTFMGGPGWSWSVITPLAAALPFSRSMTCGSHGAVDLEDDLRPSGDDRVLVPIVGLDELLQFGGGGERGDLALAVLRDHQFLAALRMMMPRWLHS